MSLNFRELLAQFVQEEPAIWDRRSNDYHLKTKRDDAWDRVVGKFLARKIACDVDYCKLTWRRMQDQYRKTYSKLTSGSEAPSNFQRQGIMAQCQFLETTMQVPGIRFSNLARTNAAVDTNDAAVDPAPTNSAAVDLAHSNDATVDDEIIIDENNSPPHDTSFPQSPSPAPLDDIPPSPTETSSSTKSDRTPLAPVNAGRRYLGKRKCPYTSSQCDKTSAIEAVYKATDAVREQVQEMKANDEYYHFGAYVTQTLRSLPKELASEKMIHITQVFAYDDITFITTKRNPTQQDGTVQHYEMTEPDGSQMTEGSLEYFEYAPPKESTQQPYHTP